jgi:hypothetical protein
MSAFSYQYTNEYLAGNAEVAVLEQEILAREQANELRAAEIASLNAELTALNNRLAALDLGAPLLYAMERYCKQLRRFIVIKTIRQLEYEFAVAEKEISEKALQALGIRAQLIAAFIMALIDQLIALNKLATSFGQKDPAEPVPQWVLDAISAQQAKITAMQNEQSYIEADIATHTALLPVRIAAVARTAAALQAAIAAYKNFAFDARARRGIGVVQPQSGLDYPLVYPSQDIKYLIADFYLSYDDAGEYDATVPPAQHPLRIKHLYGFGCQSNQPAADFPQPVNQADIVVVDANDRIILDTSADSSTICHVIDSNHVYTAVRWQRKNTVCSLIAYKKWPDDDNGITDDDTERSYDLYLTPARAILDERAVYKIPKRLLTLRVRNGQTTSPRYSGAFTFGNGYNTEITTTPAAVKNFRNITSVNFSAVAGTGLGRYGNCPGGVAVPITKINGVTAENGDFRLGATDCLWVRRPVTVGVAAPHPVNPSTTAHQQVGADCAPCCGCDDYANTAKYMNETSYRYKLIGQRAENVRTEHENNIARWLDQRSCSVQRPLRLFMVPQRCAYLDIVMMLCNPCDKCTEPTRLTVNLSVSGDLVVANPETQTSVAIRPELECGHTSMYAPGIRGAAVGITVSGGGFQYSAAFPQIKPGDSAYVQFRVKFNQYDPTSPEPEYTRARGPYVITGTLTGTYLSSTQPILTNCGNNLDDGLPPLPALAETAQTLHCNAEGKTEAPC